MNSNQELHHQVNTGPIGQLSYYQAIRLTPATLAYAISEGKWIPAPHLLYLAGEIAREILEGDARVIMEAPPRHGKSELFSVYTPTWFLDWFPDRMVMLTSYNQDLPIGFSRRVRDNIAMYGGVERTTYQKALEEEGDLLPETRRHLLRARLRGDVRQATQWQTSKGGGVYGVGIGGSLTGRGAHLLLIDDYVKNAEEAESPTIRQSTWDWFISTAFTRLEPGASIFILATRWNIDDLIGRIEHMKATDPGFETVGVKPWRIIRLPALAHENDELGRKVGEPLWPERFPLHRLLELKALLGKYYWAALYDQHPVRKEDAKASKADIIKVTALPHYTRLRKCRAWDFAGTKNAGDATSGTLLCADGPAKNTLTKYYMADLRYGHLAPSEVEELVKKTANEDGHDTTIVLEQEPGSSGKAYCEYVANTILKGFKVKISKAKSSKWLKAQPMLACVVNHRFHMVPGEHTVHFETEVDDFTGADGVADDTVDSTALAFNELNGASNVSVSWGRQEGAGVTIEDEGPAENPLLGRTNYTQGIIVPSGITWGR